MRWWLLTIIATVVLVAATAYTVTAVSVSRARTSGPSAAETTTETPLAAGRLVFRNTALGEGYGVAASVPLANPAGPRALTGEPCDRVDATATLAVCLRINRGVVTTFESTLFDARWTAQRRWPLSGIPSRTRLSDDSRLVATTAFVSGTSYTAISFSTETTVLTVDGQSYGNLEDFALLINGERVLAADRNIWGVTFTRDPDVFYATASAGESRWLVKGSLADRTLTSIRDGVECPSLSPDGTRIAFKKNVSTGPVAQWAIAVYDLAAQTEVVLTEKRSVDDQVEWLDNETLLFGMPRADAVGDSDVLSIPADGRGAATVFIEHASSPSVVRAAP